jgi:diguanylate cyclase (GGDEF)-like protein
MIDIDLFKNINDTYGHLVGDEVLKEVVRITKAPIRSVDILGRYGGEEFGLILPETNEEGAMILAEKIRNNIENHIFTIKNDGEELKIKLTVSIGVAIFPDDDVTDVKSLIKSADDALYISKDKGRNRVYKLN